ncbi:unnamed protein product, partial [Rotaria sp. Silwood1]
IDQTIIDTQKPTINEKSLFENIEQQRKDLMMKLHNIKIEEKSLNSSLKHLNQIERI